MSRRLKKQQLDRLSAALRHVRDAELLLASPDPDRSAEGAWYLAGYGPECVRKATLDDDWLDKAIGHGVVGASEVALDFALAHDPRARRYDVHRFGHRYPALASWKSEDRYDRTGVRKDADEVEALVSDARRAVDDTVFALWADGRIPGDFSW
jgi:hypothetical protein